MAELHEALPLVLHGAVFRTLTARKVARVRPFTVDEFVRVNGYAVTAAAGLLLFRVQHRQILTQWPGVGYVPGGKTYIDHPVGNTMPTGWFFEAFRAIVCT